MKLRSPVNDQAVITLPVQVSDLQKPFSGTVCSSMGDEYPIENNIVDLITKQKDFTLAQSTNHWTLTASLYEDLWRKRSLSLLTGEPFPIEKENELLIDWVNPKPAGVYLDVGCSTALYARALKKASPESTIVALDFSKQMLTEARLKAEADQTNLYLIKADARDMPFYGKTFDGVVMGGTLNELSDELKVLFECRRVLKEGGVMFMMHLVKSEYWYARLMQDSAEWGGLQFWTVDESNKLFERADFKIEDQFTKGIVCFTKLST
ncbi:MAG: class I SAM-dependent methyltransferase [Balneolaceae bacterium]